MADNYNTDPRVQALVQDLLDSADDTGCDGDLIVVTKSTLAALVKGTLSEVPYLSHDWLTDTNSDY